jgi:hypothetical protein
LREREITFTCLEIRPLERSEKGSALQSRNSAEKGSALQSRNSAEKGSGLPINAIRGALQSRNSALETRALDSIPFLEALSEQEVRKRN